uniref:Uridylate-specific endoribonuclease n=1 Tax=Mesocestoides corti TaxID=53468 RepID=A0A5K3FYX8_MESCO
MTMQLVTGLVICLSAIVSSKHRYPDLEDLFTELWELDANRLELGKDLILDPQGYVPNPPKDNAPKPLFSYVNKTRLLTSPTYQAFIELIPSYNPDILVNETVSSEKLLAQSKFITAVMQTAVMQKVRGYLEERKLISPGEKAFKELLFQMWFRSYQRRKRLSSSAFEHVFLGEGRGSQTLGFHYWLPMYLHESEGALDYFGYYEQRRGRLQNTLSVAFMWNANWLKKYATFMFGTSPEFDLGLYTVAFLRMKSTIPSGFRYALSLRVMNSRLALQCYQIDEKTLGSCYVV